MDLNQSKLSKNEWNYTEISVSQEEKEILNIIIKGYNNVNIIYNKNLSFIDYLKLEPNENIMDYIYTEYFEPLIKKLIKKYDFLYNHFSPIKLKRVNSVEKLKLENMSKVINDCGNKIFEFYLIHMAENIMHYKKKNKMSKFYKYYYTLHHLINLHIKNINEKVLKFVQTVLSDYYVDIDINEMFKESSSLIEKNSYLNKYKDFHLFEHQKQLFTICKIKKPKMILYIAPTGTGKTMSPLGLSESHKIVFVCAARHVGLALAKSAISMGKKIAFAFGCNDVSDIRLHYFSAKDYVKHNITGTDIKYKDGNKKVDNSVGDNVEIMICDIKSYLYAMYYMRAFNNLEELIMYWDEPTITMDYEKHDFHDKISEIWQKNIIPNIILSSATLPHEDELQETICDFRSRFDNSSIYTITSYDCNKSISLINIKNEIELPHLKYNNFEKLQQCVNNCKKNKTILRYFDLNEIVKFISYVDKNNYITSDKLRIKTRYNELDELKMNNIKIHYLDILENITSDEWSEVFLYFQSKRKMKYESNIYIATKDSYTLTDGPTIFLAEDVEKISKFILQSAKIPEKTITEMMSAIDHNDKIIKLLHQKEKAFEDSLGDEIEKEKKMAKGTLTSEQKQIKNEIDKLCKLVKTISLNDVYIPNKLDHLRVWRDKEIIDNEFSCDINPIDVEKIMLLEVNNNWKILLLMGIGVFTNDHNKDYTEIMKELAMQQKLYLIIASSDYIYGTNYQFCHGYISKDLINMTQYKCIQAMGRIGRNQIDKEYSIRVRDNAIIDNIFIDNGCKPEVENMNNLFNTPL